MIIKGLIDEDFINYKKPAMVIEFPYCTFKCDKECHQPVCQNSALAHAPDIATNYDKILTRYINNPITKAIVMQGLEPLDSFSDVINLIDLLRTTYNCLDDIVIYTGYNKKEIEWFIESIKHFKNIILKYGRYVPNQESHLDPILGVKLSSSNQYAEKIS